MSKKVYFLWFGQTLSWTGSQMSFFGLGVWIYETTGRASALSTILFTVAIIGTVTGPIGGVFADRFSRKKVIISMDITIAIVMCFVGWLAYTENLSLYLLIPAAIVFGIFEIAHWSTWGAFFGDRKLIEDEKGMPYDYSKAEGQRIVYDYCEKGLNASVIHPTSIVGPNDFKPGLPMQAFVDMANGKRKLMPNWGYNFIDVRDLCDAAISAVENGKTGQNYIIGGEYHMYLYIGELIGKQLGKKVVYGALPEFVTYLPLPFEYIRALFTNKPRVLTLDAIHTAQTGNKVVPSTLAREELGHNPRPIEETIFDTIDFFQKRGLVI
jgi:hypothetical protein